MISAKSPKRIKTRSFTELIPWICFISDGVVACKDGGLMASFEIGGRDFDNLASVEVDAMLARASDAFAELSVDPFTVIFTLKSESDLRYPHSPMMVAASQVLDDEHRAYVEHVASVRPRSFLTLHMAPPKQDERFFGNISSLMARGESIPVAVFGGLRSMFHGKRSFAYRAQELVHAVQRLEQAMDRLHNLLPDWSLKRLLGAQFKGFLRSTVSGQARGVVPTNHSGNWFLDSELADAPLEVFPNYLRLGKSYCSVLSIKDWPQATHPVFVSSIVNAGVPATLSVTFKMMNKEQSKKAIASVKAYAELTKHTWKDYIKAMLNRTDATQVVGDPEKEGVIADADMAAATLAEGAAYGYMNVSLALYADDVQHLEDVTDAVVKRLTPLYPGVVRESLHALSAWAGTVPGQLNEPVRWAMMSTQNLADSAPLFLPNRGVERNYYLQEQTERPAPALSVFPAFTGGHYFFNFHRGALGHTFVVGGSRSGKSVMMNFLISQFMKYEPCRVVIFDKDHSCRINTLMHGGAYLDLVPGMDDGGDERVTINPLHLIGDRKHWEFLVQWLIDLLQGKGFKVTTTHEKRIREALEDMYRGVREEDWRLSHLATLLPQDLQTELAPFLDEGRDGSLGRFFDNSRDDFRLGTITAFEMGGVMRMERVAPLVMSYAFYRIQRLLEENRLPGNRVVPTFIYLEECWFLFENEQFQERVRDWLKTLAKYGAFVVMATQSIEDMVSDNRKLFASIRDNIANMIFLPNPRANTKTVSDVYRKEFGLRDEVIEQIASSLPRRDYIIVNEDHVKRIYCSFSPAQLAFLRSDSVALSTFNEERAKGAGWQERYLARIQG